MRAMIWSVAGLLASSDATPCASPWEFAGPAGYVDQSGGGEKGVWFSATNDVVQAVSGDWFLGTVNGGVWRTNDLYANNNVPDWEPVTDSQPVTCSTISALAVGNYGKGVIAAGCGGASSGMMEYDWNVINSGDWGGLMVSADNGDSWKMTSFPPNHYISSILLLNADLMLVSARSEASDANKGGIWASTDGGETWKQTLDHPVHFMTTIKAASFQEKSDDDIIFASLAMAADTIVMSKDGGATWTAKNEGLVWPKGAVPKMSQLTVSLAGPNPMLIMGAFAMGPKSLTDITSHVFVTEITSAGAAKWREVSNQPFMLDPDHMAKDRLAVLADPDLPHIMYIAGNAAGSTAACKDGCTSVFRIDLSKDEWTLLASAEMMPHPDCRRLAWDHDKGTLLLAQDGGLGVRFSPRDNDGNWTGLGGNIGAMEFLYAHWDNRLERFIAGAQDNDVQVTMPKATQKGAYALGYLGCDGMRTAIDNQHCPARMLSSCQNLDGLTMFSGETLKAVSMDVTSLFPEASSFPFFMPPFTLNTQAPGDLLVWVNGTDKRPAGVWQVKVPDPKVTKGVDPSSLGSIEPSHKQIKPWAVEVEVEGAASPLPEEKEQAEVALKMKREQASKLLAPKHVVDVAPGIYEVVAGGFTNNVSDPSLLVLMGHDALFVRQNKNNNNRNNNRNNKKAELVEHKLPQTFAKPIVFEVANDTQILGPITHGKTTSLAVSPADSDVVAVTGWPQDMQNGEEHIWLSNDAGATWVDVMGDLAKATGTSWKVRPSGVLLVEYADAGFHALLVGTVNGAFVMFTDAPGTWSRVGLRSDFPLVKTDSLTYEHYSDTLVAATYGRGVYVLPHARDVLLKQKEQKLQGRCNIATPTPPVSSARFFPPQDKC